MADPRALAPLVATLALLGCAGATPTLTPAPPPAGSTDAPTAPGPGIGQKAPTFTLKSIDGAPLSLPTGKATILMFWATWSMPDQKELIKLQEIHARLGPANVAVIALSIDEEAQAVPAFAKSQGLTFPIGWDAGHRIVGLYRPGSEPTTYVIDRAGIIRFVHPGYHDGEADVIAAEVSSLH
jgi:peroxiredoxin